MIRTIKPKNARAKRALAAREPQLVENEKTAIFVRGEKVSESVRDAMKDLHALKLPNSINFNKKNPIHPFDADPTHGVNSLEFFSGKNDASLFVVGSHSKKRPNGLTFVRTFDGRVLDMIEVGIDNMVAMKDIKSPKSTPGHRILMSFQSSLFSTHPTFQLLKSMLLDFYNGHELTEIPLQGLETVMTITAGPMDGDQTGESSATMALEGANSSAESKEKLPLVHLRVYTVKMLASGTKVPKISLTEMGPRMDLSMRRTQMPDPEMWKEAVKRPKMDKKTITSGQGKKRKNIETDEMGDLVGRVHVGKQDLNSMKGKRMRTLNATPAERAAAKKQKAEDITMD